MIILSIVYCGFIDDDLVIHIVSISSLAMLHHQMESHEI